VTGREKRRDKKTHYQKEEGQTNENPNQKMLGAVRAVGKGIKEYQLGKYKTKKGVKNKKSQKGGKRIADK